MSLWVSVMGGVALALWAAMLIVERRRGAELRGFTVAWLVLAALAIVSHHGLRIPQALTGERIHVWNQFHYYVGSKYFGELGYHDLYAATLAADDDFAAAGGDPAEGFAHVTRTRDMHTYRTVPREEAVAGFDRGVITPERLAELGADTRWIRARIDPDERDDKTRRMLKDLGYNPAPPWTLMGTPLTNLVDLGGPLYPLITASDVLVQVLVLWVLWWAFGARTAAIAAVWLNVMPINVGRMTGAFFTYDWLGAAVLAWAAWHKDRPKLAGVALSWAAMTRVFPGLIALPVVVRTGWSLLRGQRPEGKRLAFTIAFCAACTVLLAASHGTGRGAGTWLEWKEKITIHSERHARTGAERVGLARLVRHQPRGGRFLAAGKSSPEFEAKVKRRKRVAQLVGMALLLAALWRRPDEEAMLAMLFASWLLTTSSRYYASIWLLLFTLPRARSPGVIAGTGLLAMVVLFYAPSRLDGRYLLLNYEAAAVFVGLCVVWLAASRRERTSPPPDPGSAA